MLSFCGWGVGSQSSFVWLDVLCWVNRGKDEKLVWYNSIMGAGKGKGRRVGASIPGSLISLLFPKLRFPATVESYNAVLEPGPPGDDSEREDQLVRALDGVVAPSLSSVDLEDNAAGTG